MKRRRWCKEDVLRREVVLTRARDNAKDKARNYRRK